MFSRQKLHLIQDLLMGSCAKGAVSCRIADRFRLRNVSTHNAPNAGHTYLNGTIKFVGKALPTPVALHRSGAPVRAFISPGAAFSPLQLAKEWEATGRPDLIIHERAALVMPYHAAVERGINGTKHLGSTMQGSGAAACDKLMRRPGVALARSLPEKLGEEIATTVPKEKWGEWDDLVQAFVDAATVVDGALFRDLTRHTIQDHGMLHEGSQGYGLSIDHGPAYPYVTSRNVDPGMVLSYMATPARHLGEVVGVVRANHFIRFGHCVEDGRQVGNSGPVWEDCQETSWAEVAEKSGMPKEEADALLGRELTTVTGRLRRVFTESMVGLQDAVDTCGVTRLAVTFIEYVNWEDRGCRDFLKLSAKSRAYLERLEDNLGVPVLMVGTGPDHKDCCWATDTPGT